MDFESIARCTLSTRQIQQARHDRFIVSVICAWIVGENLLKTKCLIVAARKGIRDDFAPLSA